MALPAPIRLLRLLGDRQPLSPKGALVAALAGLALWAYGYRTLDLVAFTAGVGGLALVALCALASGAAALRIRRSAVDAALPGAGRIEAGIPTPTGFSLPAYERVPLLALTWSWTEPEGARVRLAARDGRLHETVLASRRALVPRVQRRFTVGDAFGLTRFRWERAGGRAVTVLPSLGALRQLDPLHARSGADGFSHPHGTPEGDRIDIRRYAPGDGVRDILWKAFARTRQLNVRQREKSLDRSRRTVAYLLAAPGDEPAAAAARLALESGALGDEWTFGADGTPGAVDTLDEALAAIARSGMPDAREAALDGLAGFLQEAAATGAESCLVFAPGVPGPWLERALAAVRQHPGRLSFVLGTDAVSGARRFVPLWRRLLYAPEPEPSVSAAELRGLHARLVAAGCPCVVVDRSTGRQFASELSLPQRSAA